MLKIGKILIFVLLILCCKICGEYFSYVENSVYIYSFKDSTICFKDKYGSFYHYKPDSITYDYCKQNKTKYYVIRKYDNGKLEIIR